MSEPTRRVLVVEDDPSHAALITEALHTLEVEITRATTLAEAYATLSENAFDLVVLDMWLGTDDAMAVLGWVLGRRDPSPPVIFVTREDTIERGVEAMRRGAMNYIVKGEGYLEQLLASASDALGRPRIRRAPTAERETPVEIIGTSAAILHVRRLIAEFAPTDETVLILGETGVGKELVAKGIHEGSTRRQHRFLTVNCAAFARDLVESELFGHEKGAFTGAVSPREGKFEAANGGTLFLDEIGDMPLETQAKILRVLQERNVERVGGNRSIKVDVRIIAATNRDLEAMVASGGFRADLYFRLDVLRIEIPPLRNRVEDIPVLAEQFMRRVPHGLGLTMTRDFIVELMARRWRGNVRELENAIKRAVLASPLSGKLQLDPEVRDGTGTGDTTPGIGREALVRLLVKYRGKLTDVAQELNVTVRTIQRYMERFELDRRKFR